MTNELQDQQISDLSEMIEKILFDEKELEILKNLINELKIGSIDSKLLRKAIIENRAKILKKILQIFPYYYKQVFYQQEIDHFGEKDIHMQTKNELEEKNELLSQVREWIQNTRKKLEEEINI